MPKTAAEGLLERVDMHKLTSRFGAVEVGGKRLFFKRLEHAEYYRELQGYNAIHEWYPTARLLGSSRNQTDGIILFDYEDSVEHDSGLLVDVVAAGGDAAAAIRPMWAIFADVFIRTAKLANGTTSDIFFADRVGTRLPIFYLPEYIEAWNGRQVNLNGRRIAIRLDEILADIRMYFNQRTDTLCVLSQCDPNDLNLGLKPILFDYAGGGMNPLMAELATLIWYNAVQGSYLAPKYNTKAFIGHEAIIGKICEPRRLRDGLEFQIPQIRHELISSYLNIVVIPVIAHADPAWDWGRELRVYLAMRALAVFDVSKFDDIDQEVTLGILQLIYDTLPTDVGQLTNLIEEL